MIGGRVAGGGIVGIISDEEAAAGGSADGPVVGRLVGIVVGDRKAGRPCAAAGGSDGDNQVAGVAGGDGRDRLGIDDDRAVVGSGDADGVGEVEVGIAEVGDGVSERGAGAGNGGGDGVGAAVRDFGRAAGNLHLRDLRSLRVGDGEFGMVARCAVLPRVEFNKVGGSCRIGGCEPKTVVGRRSGHPVLQGGYTIRVERNGGRSAFRSITIAK